MTILHLEKQPCSLVGLHSESQCCVDCGFNTHPGCPPRELAEFLIHRDGGFNTAYTPDSEVYIVKQSIWEKAGMEPYGGCLCIGCLEKRIGRRLKPKDFPEHPFNDSNLPCTERLRDTRIRPAQLAAEFVVANCARAWRGCVAFAGKRSIRLSGLDAGL